MSLLIFTSLIVGFTILDVQGIVFEPYKIFNMPKEYVINYQTSTLVRAAPFFFGLLVGLMVIEGLEKLEN
jgi:hypothetical protein